ncbi:hypothetical protein A2387_01770 [Candidatus Nomurabacteria bacterium RIFOXYB1_FULL_36_10]|nr:MAG: hypothetical protein A2387_01770 [Candidatus Nomurabacteria bacterium RIFOXYB1_FULL_36_10]
MHRKYSNFLIISFIGVLVLGVYSYFNNDLKVSASSSGGDITSSLDASGGVPVSSTGDAKTAEDIAFLAQLIALKTIKIDTSIFNDQSFKLLVDNNIKLDPVPYGRTNPFSPADKVIANNKATISIKTNLTTLVSSKSAILNGSLEGASSNNVYFEYGTTDALGKTTPKIAPSMIGNYSTTVTGLLSKTTYFYRLTANINGVATSGDIMSFSTN